MCVVFNFFIGYSFVFCICVVKGFVIFWDGYRDDFGWIRYVIIVYYFICYNLVCYKKSGSYEYFFIVILGDLRFYIYNNFD